MALDLSTSALEFLEYPVHFFAECQAVNAYENTTPNRHGHTSTTTTVMAIS